MRSTARLATPQGHSVGRHLLERHNLIESFLRLIGVSENTLKDTERIEHIISDELVSRMADLIRFAKMEPSGLPSSSQIPPGTRPAEQDSRPEPTHTTEQLNIICLRNGADTREVERVPDGRLFRRS